MSKFCVVGAGQWGRNHVRVMRSLLGNEVSVCERSEECISNVENAHPGIKIFRNFDEVLSDKEIKAVSICTPASSHYEMVKAVLNAGKDVMVEKPLALESTRAKELAILADKLERILMVGHIFRYHPAVRELKKEIDSGNMGKINLIMASRLGLMTPRPDCGVIFDFAIHEFDTVAYLLGERPSEVSATGLFAPIEHAHEDAAFITLKYPSGAVSHIQVSWLTPLKIREILVVGSKKTARLNYLSHDLEIYDCGIVPKYDSYGNFKLIKKEGEMSIKHATTEEPLKAEISHFIDCVNTRKRPITDGQSGIDAVYTAESAVKAFKDKKIVKLQ